MVEGEAGEGEGGTEGPVKPGEGHLRIHWLILIEIAPRCTYPLHLVFGCKALALCGVVSG